MFPGGLAFASIGCASGWASPSLVKLAAEDSPIPLDNSELSWAASMLAFGGVSMTLPFSYFLNRLGRKPMIILISLVFMSGWISLIFSTTVVHIYVGRFLLGAAVGCTYGSVPVYIGEVVGQNIRGAIVTFLVMSQSIGCLFEYIIGPNVSFHTLNAVSIIVPIMMFFSFLLMPETPYFLYKQGKSKEAECALMKFRGCTRIEDIQDELKGIQTFIDEDSNNSSFLQILKQLCEPKSRKAIIIITALILGQQFTGVVAISNYMQTIFMEANSPIPPEYAVLLCEILSDVSVIITSAVMDRVGRKPLYGLSAIICILSNILLGVFYYFQSIGAVGLEYAWIPMVGVFVLRMGFDCGMAPVPMVVTSEILSYNIRGYVTSYMAFIQGGFMALVIKLFQIIKDDIGQHYPHFIFVFCIMVPTLFIMFYMPETKNKSLHQIQQDFHNCEIDDLEKSEPKKQSIKTIA